MKQQESFFPAFLSYDLSSFVWPKECWLSNPHVETALFLSLCLFVSKATIWSQGNPNICRIYFMHVWVQLQPALRVCQIINRNIQKCRYHEFVSMGLKLATAVGLSIRLQMFEHRNLLLPLALIFHFFKK